MDNDIAIRVQNITKTFHGQSGPKSIKESFVNIGKTITGKKQKKTKGGDFTVLNDINFEVKKGEFFGIVGRNGGGKSTLLKIIAGVYTPNKGAVIVNGNLTPFIELGVGFNPELSGKDNVYLNGALLGFTRKQMDAMYDDIVEFAELQDHMGVKLKNYSSGMHVRLAFSVAIRAKSDILLVDEVLAVGDAAFQQKCFNYFEQLKKDNRTVIFVTHDMESVKRFCNTAILIENGHIKLTGKPDKIANQYMLDNFSKKDDTNTTNQQLSNKIKSLKVTKVNKNILSTTENIIFSVEYELNEKVPIDLGLSIIGKGVSLMEFNTQKLNIPCSAKKNHQMTYELPLDCFNPGEYTISVSIFKKEGFLLMGFNTEAYRFTIKEAKEKVGGIIPQKGRWVGY